jgi:hypothetical protein
MRPTTLRVKHFLNVFYFPRLKGTASAVPTSGEV